MQLQGEDGYELVVCLLEEIRRLERFPLVQVSCLVEKVPSIQLGASVGQGVAETFKANRVQKNVFISSGAGAGLAAAFNAPIAGLMFVLKKFIIHLVPLLL